MDTFEVKISIIIPVYNGANFILEAIDSVLQQTHKNVDIIVIDDCSTDNTLAILANSKTVFTLLKLPHNQGASAARNMGLEHATGDYIAFLDADDLWSPYFLETTLVNMQSSPEHDFIYCLDSQIEMGSITKMSTTKPMDYKVEKLSLLDAFKDPYMATSAILFKRSMLSYIAGFDCELKTAEDIDFVLRAAEFKAILKLNATLVEVRIRKGSLGQAVASYKDNIDVIEQFLLRNPSFKQNEGSSITEIYEEIYYCWIRELLFRRDFHDFYQQSAIAIKTSPSIRISRLIFKSIPLLIISFFYKKK